MNVNYEKNNNIQRLCEVLVGDVGIKRERERERERVIHTLEHSSDFLYS